MLYIIIMKTYKSFKVNGYFISFLFDKIDNWSNKLLLFFCLFYYYLYYYYLL